MNVAIAGFDIEGKVSYDFFKAQGADITICDQNSDLQAPDGVKTQLGNKYLDNLYNFDFIIRTPGLHPNKILAKNPGIDSKITSGINLFFEHSPTKNIIGVTGTKGKGTTSTLIAKMLEAAGKQVFLGGNIGLPPLTFLNKLTADSWVVLELSSFQLIDLKYSPHIGVCLMVAPEHLNWHADMAEYIYAKSQLFAHQTANDTAIYFGDNPNSAKIVSDGNGHKLPYYKKPGAFINNNAITIDDVEICKTSELKLLGKHNWQNVCAAVTAVWQITQDITPMRTVLTSFSGLEHRLEFVRELNDVSYYDDSFGTTPETAIVAIEAFTMPKVLILGGSDKGARFNKLAKAVKENNVRSVIAIGQMGPVIAESLKNIGYTNIVTGGQTMSEVVSQAKQAAQSGDIVLLSTATASFDMFKNYKDRGDQFKQAVQALA